MVLGAPVSTKKILVAEDDDLLSEVLAAALEARGYTVDQAPAGLITPEMAREADLVILDAHIPGADFDSTLESLRRSEVGVLVLSGELSPPPGVSDDEYLGKPVDLNHLLGAVERLATPTVEG